MEQDWGFPRPSETNAKGTSSCILSLSLSEGDNWIRIGLHGGRSLYRLWLYISSIEKIHQKIGRRSKPCIWKHFGAFPRGKRKEGGEVFLVSLNLGGLQKGGFSV